MTRHAKAGREPIVPPHHRKLRDVFAAAALTGMARLSNWPAEDIARRCYALADAMLAERRRRQQ